MITNNFIEEIEHFCIKNKTDYIDAITTWCAKNNVEVEIAASWIKKDPTMKAKLQAEAENINILKKGAELPL